MGTSTEELSGEIAATRSRMASDIDALQDRVSPSAIVQRRKDAAKGRFGALRDKVMGTAQGVRDSAASTTSSATGSVQDTAHGIADRAHGAVDSAHGALGTAQDRVGGSVEGSPLAAGLVAFGAGVVLAGLFPASQKEAQVASVVADTVRDQGAPLLEEAKAAGQQLGQDLMGTAQEAAAEVKDTATESAANLKSEGQSAAEDVRSEVKPGD
jgi:gas vesicle protein